MNMGKTLIRPIHTFEVMLASNPTKLYKAQGKKSLAKSSPALCPLLDIEVHREVKKKLDMERVLDTMVDYILDKNITVYKIALECNVILGSKQMRSIKSNRLPKHLDGDIKVGRFTKAEDSTIMENWEELVIVINMNREDAILEVLKNPKDDQDIGIKQNIVGYFLAQGLNKVRLATDVFHRARVLLCVKTGYLTHEEDKQILEFVLKEGLKWSKLGKQMGRAPDVLKKRFDLLMSTETINHGSYSLEEDKTILKEVFSLHKNILKGETLSINNWEHIATKLHRNHYYLYNHWRLVLHPMLTRYQAGTLHVDFREVLINHLVEQGIEQAQEVDWQTIVKLDEFAGTTPLYLQRKYHDMRKATGKMYPDLSPDLITSRDIRKYLDNSVRNGTPAKRREREENLINFYTKNILNKDD